MGEAELLPGRNQLIIHSDFFFYGDAANEELSTQVAKDISDHWNEAHAKVQVKKLWYEVWFNITGRWHPSLTPEMIYENTNPRNNYFRIESFSELDISFVDGIGCNTGYFKLDNLLNNSTTAAHEYGHTLGLVHPYDLDIRGTGTPAIMYPRGTIVDPHFQYDPAAAPATKGGTLNPFYRKVLQKDVDDLRLHKLSYNIKNCAVVGEFSSVWHDKHVGP